MCNTLEGLFETLSNKFKLQYNETIKSLQFRRLYRYDEENVEEWMGRLCVVPVECNYQEVNRQLKELFIHGLNNKHILEEITKELMATNNDDHIKSGGVLAWGKRVEVQRAQAVILDSLTEYKQFDKIEVSDEARDNKTRVPVNWDTQQQLCRYCGGSPPAEPVPSIWKDMCRVWKCGALQKGLPQ